MRRLPRLFAAIGLLFALNQWAGRPADPPPVESAPESSTNAPYRMSPGKVHAFSIPLTQTARQSVLASKNPMVEWASAAIVVPQGFNPEVPNPLLIVCSTGDEETSSIRELRDYATTALRLGYVLVAAEGPYGRPTNDTPPWRWAMTSTLLEHLHKHWPGSRKWPMVCAGVSGGGKWSGVLGAVLANKGYNLMGVFMASVNEDYASEAAKLYRPSTRYKDVPIFLSGGSDDKLATPQQHTEVKESLLRHGFAKVRLELHKGGHELSHEDFRMALRWFLEQYVEPPEEPRNPLQKPAPTTPRTPED